MKQTATNLIKARTQEDHCDCHTHAVVSIHTNLTLTTTQPVTRSKIMCLNSALYRVLVKLQLPIKVNEYCDEVYWRDHEGHI